MSADAEFAGLAREYLDDRAERHPETATSLGDHRFDARLSDPSAPAREDERRALDGWAARLAAIDSGALSAEHQVETAIGQFDGTIALVSNQIDAALEAAPGCAAELARVRPAALEALTGHRDWL